MFENEIRDMAAEEVQEESYVLVPSPHAAAEAHSELYEAAPTPGPQPYLPAPMGPEAPHAENYETVPTPGATEALDEPLEGSPDALGPTDPNTVTTTHALAGMNRVLKKGGKDNGEAYTAAWVNYERFAQPPTPTPSDSGATSSEVQGYDTPPGDPTTSPSSEGVGQEFSYFNDPVSGAPTLDNNQQVASPREEQITTPPSATSRASPNTDLAGPSSPGEQSASDGNPAPGSPAPWHSEKSDDANDSEAVFENNPTVMAQYYGRSTFHEHENPFVPGPSSAAYFNNLATANKLPANFKYMPLVPAPASHDSGYAPSSSTSIHHGPSAFPGQHTGSHSSFSSFSSGPITQHESYPDSGYVSESPTSMQGTSLFFGQPGANALSALAAAAAAALQQAAASPLPAAASPGSDYCSSGSEAAAPAWSIASAGQQNTIFSFNDSDGLSYTYDNDPAAQGHPRPQAPISYNGSDTFSFESAHEARNPATNATDANSLHFDSDDQVMASDHDATSQRSDQFVFDSAAFDDLLGSHATSALAHTYPPAPHVPYKDDLTGLLDFMGVPATPPRVATVLDFLSDHVPGSHEAVLAPLPQAAPAPAQEQEHEQGNAEAGPGPSSLASARFQHNAEAGPGPSSSQSRNLDPDVLLPTDEPYDGDDWMFEDDSEDQEEVVYPPTARRRRRVARPSPLYSINE